MIKFGKRYNFVLVGLLYKKWLDGFLIYLFYLIVNLKLYSLSLVLKEILLEYLFVNEIMGIYNLGEYVYCEYDLFCWFFYY